MARSAHLLSVEDVAGLWHLPQAADLADLPLVARTRARSLLAPPVPALAPASGPPRLGLSRAGGYSIPVALPPDALRRNALVVAKTGKGKSTLLLQLAHAVMGRDSAAWSEGLLPQMPGLVLLDPHGDLVLAALEAVPPMRRDDVVLVDLADTDFPVALNPLDVTLGRERDKAVEHLLVLFAHVWTKFWGPRMENALEFALKSLYEANEALVAADPQQGPDRQYTLLDVAPVLSLPSFRRTVLAQLHDPELLNWWRGYYEPLDHRLQLEIINPVLTKMVKFSSSRITRRIIGQSSSTLNLTEVVRHGRILLVHTAREIVGPDTAALVGATLLGLLAVAVAEQARVAPDQRRPIGVIVDEFQTIPGADYGAMLSELRKFGASFVLATQALAHLDALDRTLRPTVLANIDHLFAFTTSAEDARLLQRELDQGVEIADLVELDDFVCYAKLTVAGQRLSTFSLALDPPVHEHDRAGGAIRVRSRQRYARACDLVDVGIAVTAARRTPLPARPAVGDVEGPMGSAPMEARAWSGNADQRRRGRRGRTARAARNAAPPGQLNLLVEEGVDAATSVGGTDSVLGPAGDDAETSAEEVPDGQDD